ncbi:TonB family protein [Acaryochloris sp. IP29b_bin.137]|uniref:TonB family protein n=1 Tax=Acaryochloris sp. IP29b_bin.137 TaxID=2969217 RepID=UPI00260FA59A|nr:TonB family protein [Acaryochloris sp. IP29b_bin.137]
MGFSRFSTEGRQRELRIIRRVLVVGLLAALGTHISSAPIFVKWAGDLLSNLDIEEPEETIELFVVDQEVPEPEPEKISPPPPTEVATEKEQAASAAEDSPPPLKVSKTFTPTLPTSDSIDTIPTDSAIASESGSEDGKGAKGGADFMGLVPGDGNVNGEPDRPAGLPNIRSRKSEKRQPIHEVARNRPYGKRTVACSPCSLPDYPLSEQREKIEGQPVVDITYDKNGKVVRAVIKKSSGNKSFDRAALKEARKKWRFKDSHRLGGQVSVEVAFVIKGSQKFQAAKSAGRREVIQVPIRQTAIPAAPPSVAASPSVAAATASFSGSRSKSTTSAFTSPRNSSFTGPSLPSTSPSTHNSSVAKRKDIQWKLPTPVGNIAPRSSSTPSKVHSQPTQTPPTTAVPNHSSPAAGTPAPPPTSVAKTSVTRPPVAPKHVPPAPSAAKASTSTPIPKQTRLLPPQPQVAPSIPTAPPPAPISAPRPRPADAIEVPVRPTTSTQTDPVLPTPPN